MYSSKEADIMNELKGIEVLRTVKRVEVPLRLKSNIDARIASQMSESLPSQWLWLAAASVVLLITINTLAIRTEYTGDNSNDPTESIATGLGIQTSNQLY